MIQIEKTEIYGWEAAIRGMRNPMNSWAMTDSAWCMGDGSPDFCADCTWYEDNFGHCVHPAQFKEDIDGRFRIGEKDFALMCRLVDKGPDHSKFLRMLTVTCDITAPLYWWKEFDTYKVGTVANSCSTMHRIHAKEFTLEDFSHERLWDGAKEHLKDTVQVLNYYRQKYIDTGVKDAWWQMIQLLPSSYNQRRTIQLNYAVLRNIYKSRKSHKLDEWRDFCTWAERLPYGRQLIAVEADRE